MLSPSECARKISQELSFGMTAELDAYVSSLGPGKAALIILMQIRELGNEIRE